MNTATIISHRETNVHADPQSAPPHKLIDMLLDGACSRLLRARDCIRLNDRDGRSNAIAATVAILEGLQGSLDHERGGELASNLDALYDYMQRRLFRADADNDPAGVDEVLGLVTTLKEAWSAIGDQVPQRPNA
ncbi:MAG TPA: flagellar export chaperone FliS [Pseudomonadales bacterium]